MPRPDRLFQSAHHCCARWRREAVARVCPSASGGAAAGGRAGRGGCATAGGPAIIGGPIIARASGLEAGSGIHLGYSPERINPGDDAHALERLVKVICIGVDPYYEMIAA